MKKYSSVFTLAFTVPHDKLDGSDIIQDDLAYQIHRRIRNLVNMDELKEAVSGPEDTVEEEPPHPLRCPNCGRSDQLEITGTVCLTPVMSPGDPEFETIEAVGQADYHNTSQTDCLACGHKSDLKYFLNPNISQQS